MNLLLRTIIPILLLCLAPAGISSARQVYLADGGMIECESYRRSGDRVVVKVNRDTLLEFDRSEINMRRTFPEVPKNRKRVTHKKHAPAATSQSGPPSTFQAPVATMPANQPKQEAKPPAPVAKMVPGQSQPPPPKPAPAEPVGTAPKDVDPGVQAASQPRASQPEPVQAAPADSPSPPDKAELERRSRQAAEMMAEAIRKQDAELMKKAIEEQQSVIELRKAAIGADGSQASAAPLPSSALGLKFVLLALACSLLVVISMWVTFEKAGSSGWKSLIPIYNMYVLMEISGKPGWWLILLFVPLVGAAILILAMLSLAEKFGKGPLFGIGLSFLPMFFFPLLAFGGAEYETQEPRFQFG